MSATSWRVMLDQLLSTLEPWIFSSTLHSHDDLSTKVDRIEQCLSQNPVDLWELRELALSRGGLMTSRFRQKAWPLLVGLSTLPFTVDDNSTNNTSNSIGSVPKRSHIPAENSNKPTNKFSFDTCDTSTEEKKAESSQESSLDLIRRDVGRSVVFRYEDNQHTQNTTLPIPTYASDRLAQALEDTIKSSLSFTDTTQLYHYYQGLHDVAGAVMHQLNYQADLGTNILMQLAQSHWRDALRENFGNLTWILNHIFLPLVNKAEPFVHYQLQVTQLEMANLILPWMITWFTHDIFDAEIAGRLVDAFMSSHPLLCLYFSVALLTHPRLKPDILQSDPNDPASLFVTLKQLPKYIASDTATISSSGDHRVHVQDLLDDALALLQQYPPRSLLNLVDPQILPHSAVLQRSSSISMFQSVRGWNLISPKYSPLGPASHSYSRAKLASGVPLLQSSVGYDWLRHRHRQRIRLHHLDESGLRPKSKLRKLQQMLFGN